MRASVRSSLPVLLASIVWVGCDKSRSASEAGPPVGAEGGQGDGVPAEPGEEPAKRDEDGEPPLAQTGPRIPAVASDHPLYGRFEGTQNPGECTDDDDCFESGCSGEVCSAEQDVMTTCEVVPMDFPPQTACGCVDGTCRWWTGSGGKAGEEVSTQRPQAAQGTAPDDALVTCDGKRCKPGQRCVSYYGIAGPQGPEFFSCEWTCDKSKGDTQCPAGTKCVTVADGPGDVCR